MIPKSGDRFSGKIMLHQCRSAAGSDMSLLSFERGGYRFLKSVFQYSAGVAAMPGHCIVRVRFRDPVPLAAGFQRVERIIAEACSPLMAVLACVTCSPR